MTERIQCGGLIEREDLCLIEVQGYAWRPGKSCGILCRFADAGIPLAFLNISNTNEGLKRMSFCLAREAMAKVPPLIEQVEREFAPERVVVQEGISIVTLYGPHFYERVALASEVYSCLCIEGIDAQSVGSSVNSISLVVRAGDVERTKQALSARFEWPI